MVLGREGKLDSVEVLANCELDSLIELNDLLLDGLSKLFSEPFLREESFDEARCGLILLSS